MDSTRNSYRDFKNTGGRSGIVVGACNASTQKDGKLKTSLVTQCDAASKIKPPKNIFLKWGKHREKIMSKIYFNQITKYKDREKRYLSS